MAWSDLFRRRDRAAFDREVMPHLDALYATAVRLTRNDKDAEDLLQDALLRAFRFFDRFEPGTNCRAWLFKILHNVFITKYRKRAREREMLDALGAEEQAAAELHATAELPEPERELLAGFVSDDVKRALERLPEEFRTAVVLCDLEELSYKEIADVMDCPVGTVMSRLHRGRRLLQQSLREYAAREGIIAAAPETPSSAAESREVATVIPLRRSDP